MKKAQVVRRARWLLEARTIAPRLLLGGDLPGGDPRADCVEWLDQLTRSLPTRSW